MPCPSPSRASPTAASARAYTTGAPSKPALSRHAHFYSDLVPGMIPIALLGSAIYLGARLLQSNLAHEKYLEESRARVRELEAEVEALRTQQTQAQYAISDATHVRDTHATDAKSRSWWPWW
ncbi:hypothetical protein BKA93DRAFT_830157 [Sparassis latifolia]